MDKLNLTKKQAREQRKREKIIEHQKSLQRQTAKRIIIWSLVIFGLGAIVFTMAFIGGNSEDSAGQVLADRINSEDNVRGNLQSTIVLTEYSDFQCPACSTYQPMLKQLFNEYGDKIQVVFRHFPLDSIHPKARIAAQAAQAAAQQGKFWEMHDRLFDNQSEWSGASDPIDDFLEYADSLNLDINQFMDDLDSNPVKDKINNDYQSGIEAGVSGTPSFYINGIKINNPRNYSELKQSVEQAIAEYS